ncbi:hypothetical protein D3C87_1539070 [compost metagenome]
MVRGCESITMPLFCAYDVPPSAGLKTGSPTRGKRLSAAPNSVLSMPLRFIRLLLDPSTVRRPSGARMFGSSERMS